MKRRSIFPMTSSAFIGTICAIGGAAFILYFFTVSPPPTYTYLRTETAEVTAIYRAIETEYLESEEQQSLSVRFNDGTIVFVNVPKKKNIQVGQFIEVDMLESDREKLTYRLAQNPIQP